MIAQDILEFKHKNSLIFDTKVSNIKKGFMSQVVKYLNKEKTIMGDSSWGVTAIYVDSNYWIRAFDRKICKKIITRIRFR